MTIETMNIHKALIELKTLDARIRGALDELPLVIANKHSNTKINGVNISEYSSAAQANFQKVCDLIRRRNSIKCAVVMSNATTTVIVSGKKYTVAEAIEMKNHGIELYKLVQNHLINDCMTAEAECNRHNGEALDHKADAYINNLYGNTDMKSLTGEIQQFREDFIKSQTYELVDPINARNIIKEYDEFVKAFEVEVDAALSVSNAITEIEVTY